MIYKSEGHGGLLLSRTQLIFKPLKKGSELFQLMFESLNAAGFRSHRLFHFADQFEHITKLPFHGKRTLIALPSSGYSDVMEGLTGGRKVESIWIFQSKFTRKGRVRSNESAAQLGKDHFQGLAESIENLNAPGQGDDGVPGR